MTQRKIPDETIKKVAEYFSDKLFYEIMKAMPVENVIDRSYRKILVFRIVEGYAKHHDIEDTSQELTDVLSLVYSSVFNPMHLIFNETILSKFHPNKEITEDEIETKNQLVSHGLERDITECPENLIDLRGKVKNTVN